MTSKLNLDGPETQKSVEQVKQDNIDGELTLNATPDSAKVAVGASGSWWSIAAWLEYLRGRKKPDAGVDVKVKF